MRQCCLILAIALSALPAAALEPSAPRYFGAPPGALAQSKARLAAGDPALRPALDELLREADRALTRPCPSVIDKKEPAPSGDVHDYYSRGPYWWPDPSQPDGMPYIRKDGEHNPEVKRDSFDSVRSGEMASGVETLALAYYFTGDERFAGKAAELLRAWYLAPATRMNPNLNHAQAVPGLNDGRGIGIIEGRKFATSIDAAGLLVGSEAWTATDERQLRAWASDFYAWLLKSHHGQDEAKQHNNHGSWYDAQTAKLALLLSRPNDAKKILEAVKSKRIDRQIEADGRQPAELERTKALGYSCFNIEALCRLATLGQYAGVDLWRYESPSGGSLRKAFDFLLPYAKSPEKEWPYEQIVAYSREGFGPLYRQASIAYSVPEYEAVLSNIPGVERARFQLLRPRQ